MGNRHKAHLAAALLGVALTACAPVLTPSQVPVDSPSPSSHIGPPSMPATLEPSSGTGLLAVLECDAPPSSVGGLAEHFGPTGGAPTADAAFAQWLDRHPFALPRKGYVLGWSDEGRALYIYAVWGRVKVAVLVSTRLGGTVGERFTVDEVRACNQEEFGTGAVEGQRGWRDSETGGVLLEIPGHEHCAWQTIRFLDLVRDGEPRQYVRDPLSLLPRDALFTTLARDVDLPDDASFSGYRSGPFELWLTSTDQAAFIVSPAGVERWPRAREPLGCV